jgi:RNA polymerase sigma-70 factor (ECF subfamily)
MPIAMPTRCVARTPRASDNVSGEHEVTMGLSPEAAGAADADLVNRLRDRDGDAFADIVRGWSPAMLHVARSFVACDASAQEAVQEAWLAVIEGIHRFEARSSLRTWIFHILVNIARRQGVRESRVLAVALIDTDEGGPTVNPSRFRSAGDRLAGGWRADAAPQPWGPEAAALNREAGTVLTAALAQLPNRQRVVVELRDIDGLTSDEVCGVLNLSPANQRVLLHRARCKLREQLESYYHHGEQG